MNFVFDEREVGSGVLLRRSNHRPPYRPKRNRSQNCVAEIAELIGRRQAVKLVLVEAIPEEVQPAGKCRAVLEERSPVVRVLTAVVGVDVAAFDHDRLTAELTDGPQDSDKGPRRVRREHALAAHFEAGGLTPDPSDA